MKTATLTGPLVLAQLPGSRLTTNHPILLHPVGQGAAVDPQITRYLGERLPRLPHDPDRTRTELRIEPASRVSHEPLSLKSRPPGHR
ncbi:hypothetical protein GCM10020218_006100 [Dactylosporangium vinaceum]